jgi:hypothetical protein
VPARPRNRPGGPAAAPRAVRVAAPPPGRGTGCRRVPKSRGRRRVPRPRDGVRRRSGASRAAFD